jgi:hypothetical protein
LGAAVTCPLATPFTVIGVRVTTCVLTADQENGPTVEVISLEPLKANAW